MSLYAKPCPFFITFCHRDIFSTALKSPSVFVYTLYCKSNNKTIAAPAQSAKRRMRADWNVPTACNKFQTGFTGWTGFECDFVASCQSCSSRPLCLRPVSILNLSHGRRILEQTHSQTQICVNPCESVSEKENEPPIHSPPTELSACYHGSR